MILYLTFRREVYETSTAEMGAASVVGFRETNDWSNPESCSPSRVKGSLLTVMLRKPLGQLAREHPRYQRRGVQTSAQKVIRRVGEHLQ
jgi:hypothetical protein